MNQSKISVRYAKALFLTAQEKNILDEVKKDIENIESVCKMPDFKLILENPVIKTKSKLKIISEIFNGKINESTLKFIQLVTQNKREVYIPAICRNFTDKYLLFKGIKSAKIITASEIDNKTKEKISKIISEQFKADLELASETDKSLIGGFILRVGDKQIDASVSTKLKQIKRELLNKSI